MGEAAAPAEPWSHLDDLKAAVGQRTTITFRDGASIHGTLLNADAVAVKVEVLSKGVRPFKAILFKHDVTSISIMRKTDG